MTDRREGKDNMADDKARQSGVFALCFISVLAECHFLPVLELIAQAGLSSEVWRGNTYPKHIFRLTRALIALVHQVTHKSETPTEHVTSYAVIINMNANKLGTVDLPLGPSFVSYGGVVGRCTLMILIHASHIPFASVIAVSLMDACIDYIKGHFLPFPMAPCLH